MHIRFNLLRFGNFLKTKNKKSYQINFLEEATIIFLTKKQSYQLSVAFTANVKQEIMNRLCHNIKTLSQYLKTLN